MYHYVICHNLESYTFYYDMKDAMVAFNAMPLSETEFDCLFQFKGGVSESDVSNEWRLDKAIEKANLLFIKTDKGIEAHYRKVKKYKKLGIWKD